MYRQENKLVDLNRANIDCYTIAVDSAIAIPVDVLRLDKIHQTISGNKWFKLKYYIADAIENGFHGLLTFGGAYSNHILATACAAKAAGLASAAIIRGEESVDLSPSLREAAALGMQLYFTSRSAYKEKEAHPLVRSLLHEKRWYLIPEGGAGKAGVEGSKEILQLVHAEQYTHIICAVGTGTMFSGLSAAASETQQVIGIPVLKGFETATEIIKGTISNEKKKENSRFFHQFHFGGYAKTTATLIAFMNAFYQQHHIPTDFVYTAKLFYAISSLARDHYFPVGSRLLAIHSGGLQGNRSLPVGSLLF